MAQAAFCDKKQCRYHAANGAREIAQQRRQGPTCTLLLSNFRHTLSDVARVLGVTRERARQIEIDALAKVARRLVVAGVIQKTDMDPVRFRRLIDISRRASHQALVPQLHIRKGV